MQKFIINSICKSIKDINKRKIVYDLLSHKYSAQKYQNLEALLNKKEEPQLVGYPIKGQNNKIIVIENGVERNLRAGETISGLWIDINGNNNIIKLELPIKAENSQIIIGNDNVKVEIGSTNRFVCVFIRCCFGDGQYVKIGKGTTISGVAIHCDEKSGCIIGEDCKFSNSIRIWPSDGHSILDAQTKEILNEPKGYLTIGNHVWIGEAVRLTKNARIHDNSIIGGGAVAYKDYEESNVVIAGNPAKIVRRNITWDGRNSYHLQRERERENFDWLIKNRNNHFNCSDFFAQNGIDKILKNYLLKTLHSKSENYFKCLTLKNSGKISYCTFT